MRPAQPQDPYRAMLRGGLVPTLVVAVLALAVAVATGGARGAAGSLLASAVVVASFSSGLLVLSRVARTAPPITVMAVALLTYTTKVGLLGLLLLLVGGASWLSGDAFGLTAVATALVWLAGELRAFTRVRTLVFDESGPARGANPGAASMTAR
ncbi:hypothetical protein [Quadrisphaera sp. DSM 44207]|uniref:hypothetical protein n=1 Tax=Quadrisphaera sp. DSM 44207 TaxID=1881057 RepID=UPI0008866C7C|nr:hypothetical protein [Quadrisphaera sp. DSM 44207]SDQ73410.1 ATP synthase protein I [Quadrisphaera sp. DSM 44207]